MVVIFGLGVIFVTAFLPTFVSLGAHRLEILASTPTVWSLWSLSQIQHLLLLWSSPGYLSFYRWILLPLRRLILPIVMFIARIESL